VEDLEEPTFGVDH